MDLDIEKIHSILLAANLPSSINDLKNPTEEYVVNLFNVFFKRFYIDVSAMDKPTMEQQDVMSYCEDIDIIALINLHIVMLQICDRIYIKDLCITDIISPGSKRIRKQAKFLSNFILYATNKESDIDDKINEIQSKVNMLDSILKRNNDILKVTNEKALHKAKQLSVKDKLLIEIKNVQLRLEKNMKTEVELTKIISKAERKKQEVMESNISYKAQASKLSKTLSELQSEVVNSPKEYNERLNELNNQQAAKLNERQLLQKRFQDKKNLMEQQQSNLNFIQKELEGLEIGDINEKLKKSCEQEDSINKQIKASRIDTKELETKLQSQQDQKKKTENEINVLRAQCEKRLSSSRSLYSQLLSKKKLCQQNLETMQTQYNDDSLKLNKIQNSITKVEEETAAAIKHYQDVFDNEIATEKLLMENMGL